MMIESRNNPIIKATRALLQSGARREAGTHLIEGEKLVAEAVASGARILDLFLREGQAFQTLEGARVHSVTQSVLESICDAKTPQGVAAVVQTPDLTPPTQFPEGLLVLLDSVQDPGNVGAIIRSSDAFGACGVLLGAGCADPFAPKTLRAAMGSTYHVPIWQGALPPLLDGLHAQGYLTLCGHLRGAETLPPLGSRVALVIGSEGQGVSNDVAARCTLYRLPMPGRAESLNASVAAGVLLYAVSMRMPH